jgi:protein phosphatase
MDSRIEMSENPPLPPPEDASKTRRLVQPTRSGTRPLTPPAEFRNRPAGAIFGDRFRYVELLESGAFQKRYHVDWIYADNDEAVHVCPNPECGAIFPPRNEVPELYCTDCGTKLELGIKNLLLIESNQPQPESLVRVVSKGLSHGSIRAPLAAFTEQVAGLPRYCWLMPEVVPFGAERIDLPVEKYALTWGRDLARGLDYLHDNGIHFNGTIDPAWIGMIGNRVVWSDFSGCLHHPEGYVADRYPDMLALARLIYFWLTGRENYEPNNELAPALRNLFDQVFSTGEIRNSLDLARAIDDAIQEAAAPLSVDLHSGRLSHVGMVRSLNEDSLLVLELDRAQQSVSRVIGIYVVADGMGGHASGEVASGQIVDLFANRAFSDLLPGLLNAPAHDLSNWLVSTVQAANREVFNLRKSAGTDMGSTLVAAAMIGNRAFITHVGDSRAYLLNEREIRQLTVDHSLVERMIANRQISRAEARHHPQRNVIYRTVGAKPDLEIELIQHSMEAGEYLLLCSDGLSGMVDDQTLHQIILSANSPQDACNELVNAANAAGGVDNISVILVKVVAA